MQPPARDSAQDGEITSLIEDKLDNAPTNSEHLNVKDDELASEDTPKVQMNAYSDKQSMGIDCSDAQEVFALLPLEAGNSICNEENYPPMSSTFVPFNNNSVLVSSSFKRRVIQQSTFSRQESHISVYM